MTSYEGHKTHVIKRAVALQKFMGETGQERHKVCKIIKYKCNHVNALRMRTSRPTLFVRAGMISGLSHVSSLQGSYDSPRPCGMACGSQATSLYSTLLYTYVRQS